MRAIIFSALLAAACQPAAPSQPAANAQPPGQPPAQTPASVPAVSSPSTAPTFARTEVDDFAKLFGLERLSIDGPEELRVWSQEYVFGNVHGIIVTPQRITVHEVQDATPGRPHRLGVRETAQASPVFGEMDYLSGLNGVEWSCPVVDGGALFLDGRHNGKRFTMAAVNAEVCKADSMKRLNQALALIGDLPKPR